MFLFNNLLFGVGEIFHSNVWWSRAFAFRKGTAFGAYLMAGVFWMPVPIVAGFIALAAPAMGLNVPALDMVGPLVVAKLLGGPGAIMILCIVFASLASSLDSLLAATTDLLVQDVYRASIQRDATPRQLVKAGHTITIGLSALAIAVCWTRPTTLAELIQFTGPFVASTIWPIAAGLYFRSASRHGATAGMVLGTGCGIAAYFVVGFFAAALVSATVSMLCVAVGMGLSRGRFDWRDLDEAADAR
jgi:Na+/proline symporter